MGRVVFETYDKEDGVHVEPIGCKGCHETCSDAEQFTCQLRKAAQQVYQAPTNILYPVGVEAPAAQTRTRRPGSEELQVLYPPGVQVDGEGEDSDEGDRAILLPISVRRR